MKNWTLFFLVCVCLFCVRTLKADGESAAPPNILLVTVDDMNCDSVGAFGAALEGTTPVLDRLAAGGTRFANAHVVVANCQPSRNCMMTGRFPHNSGVEGFYDVERDYPVLPEVLRKAGYFTAIRGKASHSTPEYPTTAWDRDFDLDLVANPQIKKNAASYGISTTEAFRLAKQCGKPLFLSINISDPHKPFYAFHPKKFTVIKDRNLPSRTFTAAEVPVPGFLFDHPAVRTELAHYYCSVRRSDDCLDAILDAVESVGEPQNTCVIFLSDHGMPLPFAKTAAYHHSTHTPLVVSWPGVVEPGTVVEQMVSSVSLMPTVLDVASVAHPPGLDGHSLLPLLKGGAYTGPDCIFKEYNESSSASRNPMRAVQTDRFLYIFSPWVDGKRTFRTATVNTLTFATMKSAAKTDPELAKRVEEFRYGQLEALYDYRTDPDCLNNLADYPEYAETLEALRRRLEEWMRETGDHALGPFLKRDAPAVLHTYVQRKQAEAWKRSKQKKLARAKAETSKRKKN